MKFLSALRPFLPQLMALRDPPAWLDLPPSEGSGGGQGRLHKQQTPFGPSELWWHPWGSRARSHCSMSKPLGIVSLS